MATFNFSALADGQTISFNPGTDILNFDQTSISAADISVVAVGTSVQITYTVFDSSGTFVVQSKDVVLQNTAPQQLATSNVTFANGSAILLGDNSAGTTGDDLANTITGTSGNDLLQGFGGADTMSGGLGNDTYIVSTGDVVSDSGGIDMIISDVSWNLGAEFENIRLTGTARADVQGNNLDNVITGNDGANFINGRAGNDTIRGMGGNDSIDMSTGGTGNIGHRFIDGGAGIDQVDYDGYAQSAVVVNLASNTATGGSADGTGSVTLFGIERVITGAFNDSIIGSGVDEYLDGRGGNDTLTGGGGSDTLSGGAGNDVLRGDGNDALVGGAGADSFFFATASGAVTGGAIADFTTASDKIWLDANAFAAIGAGGNFAAGDPRFFAAAGATAGHDADDRIIYDTSTGQLFYDADGNGPGAAKLVTTLQGAPALAATDLAVDDGTSASSPSAGNDSLTGTTGNDLLDGGFGNDTINGNSGADTLIGGGGNDSLVGGISDAFEQGDQFFGGDGDDTMDGWGGMRHGGEGVDTMDGGLGNDLFVVDNPNDVLTDAGGIDTVDARDMSWTLAAGFENLNIRNDVSEGGGIGIGNELDNRMAISFGSAQLRGLGGNDTLVGSVRGADTLLGGDGNDLIQEHGTRSGVLDGGAGNDTLDALGGGNQYIFAVAPGAANADTITAFAVGDRIRLDGTAYTNIGFNGNFVADDVRFFAGAGATSGHDADDRVIYNTTNGQLFYDADGSGPGASQLIATLRGAPPITATSIAVDNGTNPPLVQGTAGNDSLTGTAGGDTIDGAAGNDTINGLAGNDSLVGGAGNDSLLGGDNADTLVGGDGDDTLQGDASGVDTVGQPSFGDSLDGGLGNDTFIVTFGDVITDAGGIDTVIASRDWVLGAGLENLTMVDDGTGGRTVGQGNELDNVIVGSTGPSLLDGVDGNDLILENGTAPDTIHGGNGNDTIRGGASADVTQLLGDAGNDRLVANGNAVMTGGAGIDTFVFVKTPGGDPAGLKSSIVDFAPGVEKIELDGSFHANIGASGNFIANDSRFFAAPGASSAHDTTDRVIYDTTTGNLWYDADGTGAGAARLIATLQGAPALSATDIVVANGTSGTPTTDGSLAGTAGNDSLTGTPGNDTIDGGAGNDTIDGGAGNDTILGGIGDDSLTGGAGTDFLAGGDGNDTLDGANSSTAGTDADVDTLDGGLGDDRFIVDNAADVLSDSGGVDTVLAKNVSWTLGAGFENLQVSNAALSIPSGVEGHPSPRIDAIGNELNNVIDARPGAGDLFIDGRVGNDTLLGSDHWSDTLLGGDGNDSIDAMGDTFGSDSIDGGAGNDTLTGGSFHGNTTFAFSAAPGSANADLITDFSRSASDKIQLDGTTFTAIGAAGNFAAGDARFFSGFGAASGHDADDRVVYDTATGNLWYDADGSGAGAAQLIATLQGAPTLAASDIAVVNGTAAGSSIQGTEGNDNIQDTAGDDVIDAKGGNDIISSNAGSDTILGGAGGDFILVNASAYGNDLFDGGAGTDFLEMSSAQSALVVDLRAGTVTGGHADGGGGATIVNVEGATGTQFADRLVGNDAGVFLEGGNGNDTLIGGAGDDSLVGQGGNDSLSAGAGNDTLGDSHDQSVDADTMDGGVGNDIYFVQGTTQTLVDAGGVDTIEVQGMSWTLGAGFENLVFYNLANDNGFRGFSGTGNELDNTIDAHQGLDGVVARGLAGNDSIVGTFYTDTLDGGAGNDTLVGLDASAFKGSSTPGFDTYAFSAAPGAANADLVVDFSPNTDKIQLDGTFDANIGASGNFIANDGRFFAGAGATSGHDATDRVIYDTTTGNLWYDADGNGAGASQLIAMLQGAPAISATDIAVINGTSTTPPSTDPSGQSITGTAGNDSLTGTDGNDTLDGGAGADTMAGGLGNDTYFVDNTLDVLSDTGGIDTVVSSVSRTLGADFENITLTGTTRTDVQGNNLNNVVTGSDAANFINARAGDDTIHGMGGNDSIDMSTGSTGLVGNRVIDGGAGIDTVDYDGYAQSAVFANLGTGAVTGGGTNGTGSARMTSIERLITGAFNDSLTGSGVDEFMDGRGGNDTLAGGGGSDTLIGGAGNDVLRGDGNDVLTGGAGADSFVFATAPGALSGGAITDFTSASDKISLDHAAFAAMGALGNFAAGDARFFEAAGATAGHDADDRVIYDTSSGALYYDADGSGTGAAQQITVLAAHPALAATDITVA